MSVIPPPPVADGDPARLAVTSADLDGALASGVYGTCCLCQHGGTRWLDLSALGLAPVVDQTGTLTDQVALHRPCIAGLIGHWTSMLGAGPGDDEPGPSTATGGGEPAGGDADSVAWSGTRATSERARRMGGVYAR